MYLKIQNFNFLFSSKSSKLFKNRNKSKAKKNYKLLDLNWLQSKDQYKVNDGNKTDKKNVEMPQLHNGNPSVNVYDVNKK